MRRTQCSSPASDGKDPFHAAFTRAKARASSPWSPSCVCSESKLVIAGRACGFERERDDVEDESDFRRARTRRRDSESEARDEWSGPPPWCCCGFFSRSQSEAPRVREGAIKGAASEVFLGDTMSKAVVEPEEWSCTSW